MRKIKLTREEKSIEDALIRGEYVDVDKKAFDEVVKAIEARRKNAVLNIRVNKYDLDAIKQKAQKLGVKYQTFISEILHTVAQSKT